MRFSRICVFLLIVPCCIGALKDEKKILVEHSKPITGSGDHLGTTAYKPTAAEEKLAKTWKEKEEVPFSSTPESLTASSGKWIGWFGIVREVKEDKAKKQTLLLVESKHFDGLVDLHQQIVSIYGAGDFRAVIKGIDHKIKPLSLVRVWDWGLFAFMHYGKDGSNAKWVALRKLAEDKMYSSHPDDKYYEELLGKR